MLMISHKFREVMAFCDDVTVLRHGCLMGEGSVASSRRDEWPAMMMGMRNCPGQAVRLDVNGHSRPTSAWRFRIWRQR